MNKVIQPHKLIICKRNNCKKKFLMNRVILLISLKKIKIQTYLYKDMLSKNNLMNKAMQLLNPSKKNYKQKIYHKNSLMNKVILHLKLKIK